MSYAVTVRGDESIITISAAGWPGSAAYQWKQARTAQ